MWIITFRHWMKHWRCLALQQKYEKTIIDQISEIDRQAADLYGEKLCEVAKFPDWAFLFNNAQTGL